MNYVLLLLFNLSILFKTSESLKLAELVVFISQGWTSFLSNKFPNFPSNLDFQTLLTFIKFLANTNPENLLKGFFVSNFTSSSQRMNLLLNQTQVDKSKKKISFYFIKKKKFNKKK